MNDQAIKDRIDARNTAIALLEMADDTLVDCSEAYHRKFWETMREAADEELAPPTKQATAIPPIARLGATVLPFGQHKDNSFDDTPLDYLDWLCRSQEEFYKDLRAYLKHPDLESRRRGLDS